MDEPKLWNVFHKSELKPKNFSDHDVNVEVEACSICAFDLHTITSGCGEYTGPFFVGHEVIDKAVKVEKHVKIFQISDRIGVGAHVWACLECDLCKDKNENYCPKLVNTYNSQYEDSSQAHGRFASHIRAHEYFTFKSPDAIETNIAASLLYAGITTYSPLVRTVIRPGKTVGIDGMGGAKAYALTHSPNKNDDCKKLGAKDVIITTDKG